MTQSIISTRSAPCIAAILFLLGTAACGGVTRFAAAQPFAIAGTLPPPPREDPKPPPRVELRDNRIEFKEKIQFEVDKAVIKEESFSLLHDIAEVIKKNPQVKKISIEGHASAEGDARYNKKLSDERSKSVMEFLSKREGVEGDRLLARGWGEEKPIASNDTEEGREKNRRVEFLVVQQDITAKKIEIDPSTGKERVVDEKKESYKAPEVAPPTGAETPMLAADTNKAKGPKADEPRKAENKK